MASQCTCKKKWYSNKKCAYCVNKQHEDEILGDVETRRRSSSSPRGNFWNGYHNTDDDNNAERKQKKKLVGVPFLKSKSQKVTKASLSRLKSMLIADDKALLAEANEIRRLTDPSTWIDSPNSPPTTQQMIEASRSTSSEYEIASLCSEIHRRIKTAISKHKPLLDEIVNDDFAVDAAQYSSNPVYREGIRHLSSTFRRFGSRNVLYVLEKLNKEDTFRTPTISQRNTESLSRSPFQLRIKNSDNEIDANDGKLDNSNDDEIKPEGYVEPRLLNRLNSARKLVQTGVGQLSPSDTGIVLENVDSGNSSINSKDAHIDKPSVNIFDGGRVLSGFSDVTLCSNDEAILEYADDQDEEEEEEEDGTGVNGSYEGNISKLPIPEQIEILNVLPLSLFMADASLTMAQVWRETGRPPLDQVECIRGVTKVSKRIDLISSLPASVSAGVLLELKLRGCFDKLFDFLSYNEQEAIKKEFKSGKKHIVVHKSLPKDLSLSIMECTCPEDISALLQRLKISQSTTLLLEIHRRGAAGILLDDLAVTIPNGVCSLLTHSPQEDRSQLLKCMNKNNKSIVFTLLSDEIKIEVLFPMKIQDRKQLLNQCNQLSKNERIKIDKTLNKLDIKKQKFLKNNSNISGMNSPNRSRSTGASSSSSSSYSMLNNMSNQSIEIAPKNNSNSSSKLQRIFRSVRVNSNETNNNNSSSSSFGSGGGGVNIMPLSPQSLMKLQQQHEKSSQSPLSSPSFIPVDDDSYNEDNVPQLTLPLSLRKIESGSSLLVDNDDNEDNEDDAGLMEFDEDRYAAAEVLRTRSYAGNLVQEANERYLVIAQVKEEYERRTPLDEIEVQEYRTLTKMKDSGESMDKKEMKRLKYLKKIHRRATKDQEKKKRRKSHVSTMSVDNENERRDSFYSTQSTAWSDSDSSSTSGEPLKSPRASVTSPWNEQPSLSPGIALKELKRKSSGDKLLARNLSNEEYNDSDDNVLQQQLQLEQNLFLSQDDEEDDAEDDDASISKFKRNLTKNKQGLSTDGTGVSGGRLSNRFKLLTRDSMEEHQNMLEVRESKKGYRSNISADDVLSTSFSNEDDVNNSLSHRVNIKIDSCDSGASMDSNSSILTLRSHSENAASQVWKAREKQLKDDKNRMNKAAESNVARSPHGKSRYNASSSSSPDHQKHHNINKDVKNTSTTNQQSVQNAEDSSSSSSTSAVSASRTSQSSTQKRRSSLRRVGSNSKMNPSTPRTPKAPNNKEGPHRRRNSGSTSRSITPTTPSSGKGGFKRNQPTPSPSSTSSSSKPLKRSSSHSRMPSTPRDADNRQNEGSRSLSRTSSNGRLQGDNPHTLKKHGSGGKIGDKPSSSSPSSLTSPVMPPSPTLSSVSGCGRNSPSRSVLPLSNTNNTISSRSPLKPPPPLKIKHSKTVSSSSDESDSGSKKNPIQWPTSMKEITRLYGHNDNDDDDVKSVDMLSDTKKSPSKSPVTTPTRASYAVANCRQGHGLRLFKTPELGWYCSECHSKDSSCERFPENSKMYGCRICDYDLCPRCYREPSRTPQLEQVQCFLDKESSEENQFDDDGIEEFRGDHLGGDLNGDFGENNYQTHHHQDRVVELNDSPETVKQFHHRTSHVGSSEDEDENWGVGLGVMQSSSSPRVVRRGSESSSSNHASFSSSISTLSSQSSANEAKLIIEGRNSSPRSPNRASFERSGSSISNASPSGVASLSSAQNYNNKNLASTSLSDVKEPTHEPQPLIPTGSGRGESTRRSRGGGRVQSRR